MKITTSLIDKLIRLRMGETLPSSAIRGEWVEELLRDGVLISRSHGSRRSIMASSPQDLEQSLKYIDERLGNLDKIKDLLSSEASRSEQATETGNSKLVSVRSCPGFPVNSYEPITCCLNGRQIIINPEEGSFVFITDWQSFSVPKDVLVVNIENMENFRLVRQQQALFSSMFPGKQILFVSRYPQSSDLRSWLQTVSNQYVHFGDFDLAGINIFLTEFHKYLGVRSVFFIPQDIEGRLQHGSSERYNAQYQRFKNLSSDIPSLQRLINMINKYHRCYDQEGYIER
ncbi:MAG: hypothetical protein MR933_05995 [Prevotella sp.]|uniref:DUF7281 domain-containing protein n=1 Tax=Prevotella sp. TaxID=59823 RepID=UPI0025CD4AB6|nr:hypothetical protein [Prevotella sp.]MCI7119329.1 hypothetical protein [Prevotella sp.]